MNVLILNKWGLTSLAFPDWLGPGVRLFQIANPMAAKSLPAELLREQYEELHVVDDYDVSPEPERIALEIATRVRIDLIVAMSETDVIRAARLRERLRVPGQNVASAVAYRDKLHMKSLLGAAAIPVTRHRAVDNYTDLVAAAEILGFPLVLKPRRGAGSVGIDIIRDRGGLDEVARRRLSAEDDAPAALIAEEYIEHDLFHIDGLLVDGKLPYLWPSQMTNTLRFETGEIMRSVVLDPADPLREELCDLTRRAVASLPSTPISIIHAEIFRDVGTGALIMNEVAARLGGARVKASFKLSHGIDLVEEFVRLLPRSQGERRAYAVAERRPHRSAGFLLLPPRPGTVRAVPAGDPPAGVQEVRCRVRPGETIASAVSSVDAMASVTAIGADRTGTERVLVEAERWMELQLVVEPEPAGAPR